MGGAAAAAHALAGIGHGHFGNAEALNRLSGKAGAAEQSEFFVLSEPAEEIVDAFFERRLGILVNGLFLGGNDLKRECRRDQKE